MAKDYPFIYSKAVRLLSNSKKREPLGAYLLLKPHQGLVRSIRMFTWLVGLLKQEALTHTKHVIGEGELNSCSGDLLQYFIEMVTRYS